jgi:hypothetical protein
MAYTYDDFQKAASGSNVNFSQYDLDLAKKYPEFGMSVLDLKKQYAGATTAEQRALINAKANQLRRSYGNYTAGADGSQYVSDGKYAPKIDETLDKIGSFKSFTYGSAPSYENRYQQKQQELLDAALNRDPFSWSKETDPQYGSYKKTYLREGERATANALAQASAASGGRPSSYAVNAATQAGDYYATKLSDVIPTLYQQAYERYLKDYQMKLSDLNAVNQQEQLDYAKYLDQLGQFNTDRNFDYNNYLGEYGRLQDYLGNLQGQDNTEYNRYLGVLDEIREKQQQEQELSRSQIDAMLQAGASPSAGLIGKSGYESEYVKVLENYYKQQAAAKASGGGRSGGRTGGGGKPKSKMSLTTAQKMAKAGQFTQEVLDTLHAGGFNDAYLASEYGYTGGGSGRTKFGYDPDEGIFTWNGYRFNSPEAFAEALDRAALTDAEKAEISRKLKANGFNITF